jgi:hypothetical protein
MSIIGKYQNFIMVGVVVVAAFIGYSYFFTGKEEPVLEKQAVTGIKNPVDQELIALLLQLRGIKLDDGIFSDPVFLSLQDFSQELVPEPVGRVNPFSAYGAGSDKETKTR